MSGAKQPFLVRAAPHVANFFTITGMLIGLGILMWQVFFWLRNGIWHPVPLGDAFTFIGLDFTAGPPSKWVGLARIGHWLLSVPSAIGVPIVLTIIGFALGSMLAEQEKSDGRSSNG